MGSRFLVGFITLNMIFYFDDSLGEGIHEWADKNIEDSFTLIVTIKCQINENSQQDKLDVLSK